MPSLQAIDYRLKAEETWEKWIEDANRLKKVLKQEIPLEIPITKGVIKLTLTLLKSVYVLMRFCLNKFIGKINLKNKQRLVSSPTLIELQD